MTIGNDSPRWPRRFPIWRIAGFALAIACGILFLWLWLQFAPPLARFYFPAYVRASLFGDLPSFRPTGRSQFRVAFLGGFLATDEMLAHPPGPLSIRLVALDPKGFHRWLRQHIYRGKDLAETLRWPLTGLAFCFAGFVAAGAYLDQARNRQAHRGRRLRGPALISRWRFNRRTRGDGLQFRLENRRNLIEWLQREAGRCLRIPRNREAHHIQIAGDTGSGKSTLVREILYQIEARGEVAIVFDPDREYVQEFFSAQRGDWILNPKDDRCPYWPIGAEAEDEAEATPIANGLFPDDPTAQKFFLNHTRAIFAYLLAAYAPTVNELGYWMAHPKEIDKRVEGTEHAHTLTANAAPQRAGILGSLNEAGKPLRMMPTHSEGRRVWTVREWSQERRGWVFITSTPDTIDALRPLQSLWLDMLILKLQTNEPKPGQARVWMILDELASLNALPQLHSALTKQRKSDNPIVIGFQGMSQLDYLYGKKAETILSQAFSNFILRTREPRAARHLSELIGRAQIERIRESKPEGFHGRRHRTYSTERVVDPVVMESEVQGLDDLHGYFLQQDKVVAIRFWPRPKRKRAPDLIPRIIPPVQSRPLDPEAPAETKPEPANTIRRGRKKVQAKAAGAQMGIDLFS